MPAETQSEPRSKKPDYVTFLVTLLPPFVYMAWIRISLHELPAPARIVPLILFVCVGIASYILNGLRKTGFRNTLMDLRWEEAQEARKEDLGKIREKIGSTLTTLTMIGSLCFAMVIFALPLPFLSDEALAQLAKVRPAFADEADLIAMARPTFVFIVMILVFTSVVFLVAIDAYDSARDSVLDATMIHGLRVFARGTYFVGLLNLVYTVLLACVVVQPMASVAAALGFLIAVVLYDESERFGRAIRAADDEGERSAERSDGIHPAPRPMD